MQACHSITLSLEQLNHFKLPLKTHFRGPKIKNFRTPLVVTAFGKGFIGGHQVVADLFFFFQHVRLEKHHACQHVQYGNQNYLNNRSQTLGLVFQKSTCAVVNYPPYQDIRIRTTWKRESGDFDIYIWKLLVTTN